MLTDPLPARTRLKNLGEKVAGLARWLTEPSPLLGDRSSYRKARLLATSLLGILALFGLYHSLSLLLTPNFQLTIIHATGYLLLVGAYTLSRSRYYQLGAALLVCSFFAIPLLVLWGNAYSNPALVLTFAIPGVLLTSLFFSVWTTSFVALLLLGATLLLPVLASQVILNLPAVAAALGVNSMCSILVIVATVHHTLVERDQRVDLAESEERFRALFHELPEGVILADPHDPDGLWPIMDCNRAFCRMNGYARAELVGKPLDILHINAEDPSLRRDYLERLRLQGRLVKETVHRRRDGSLFPVQYSTGLITLRDQELLLGVDRDVTERKRMEETLRQHREHLAQLVQERTKELEATNAALRAKDQERRQVEEELRKSRRRYWRLVALARAGIYEYDLVQQRMASVNDYMCAYTGYEREELLSMNPLQLMTPESQQQFLERQRQAAAGQEVPEAVEYEILRKDGQKIFGLLSTALLVEDGMPKRAIVIAHDITKRVEAAEQLRAALQEKEVLLAEIHHRVKNNLQMVSSLLDMQALAHQEPKVTDILNDSQSRVKAMALVHESLYGSPDLASIQVAEYVQELVRHLIGIYGDQLMGVALDVQVEDASLDLDCAIACGLIINELVSNALKYAFPAKEYATGEAEGTITIRLQRQADGRFVLDVGDDGVGLPANITLDHPRSLGLRLVKMLARQMRGTIELDRQNGAAFKITFSPAA